MRIDVIELELICPNCGLHRIIVPVELPRPDRCVHCFLPATRREIGRFTIEGPVEPALGNEAWVG